MPTRRALYGTAAASLLAAIVRSGGQATPRELDDLRGLIERKTGTPFAPKRVRALIADTQRDRRAQKAARARNRRARRKAEGRCTHCGVPVEKGTKCPGCSADSKAAVYAGRERERLAS